MAETSPADAALIALQFGMTSRRRALIPRRIRASACTPGHHHIVMAAQGMVCENGQEFRRKPPQESTPASPQDPDRHPEPSGFSPRPHADPRRQDHLHRRIRHRDDRLHIAHAPHARRIEGKAPRNPRPLPMRRTAQRRTPHADDFDTVDRLALQFSMSLPGRTGPTTTLAPAATRPSAISRSSSPVAPPAGGYTRFINT